MNQRNRFIKLAKLQADPIPNKKLNIGSLSEALRKEVKQLMKEGKTKVSQFPDETKKKVIKEMSMPKLSSGLEGTEAFSYDSEKLKLLWTLNRDTTGKTFAQFEVLCHELFGKGWPSGMPPDIADTMRAAKSAEQFVAMVEKDRAEGRAAVADFDRNVAMFNPEADPQMEEGISSQPAGKPFRMDFVDKNGQPKSVGSNSRDELKHYAEMMGLSDFTITPPEEVPEMGIHEGGVNIGGTKVEHMPTEYANKLAQIMTDMERFEHEGDPNGDPLTFKASELDNKEGMSVIKVYDKEGYLAGIWGHGQPDLDKLAAKVYAESQGDVMAEGDGPKQLLHITNDDNGNKVYQQVDTENYYVMCDGAMYKAADDIYFEPLHKVSFPYEVVGANFDE